MSESVDIRLSEDEDILIETVCPLNFGCIVYLWSALSKNISGALPKCNCSATS